MSHTKVKAIFAIRHKPTGDFITFNAKCAWQRPANAKSAWALHIGCYIREEWGVNVHFDEQSEYEIVELLAPFFRLEGLEK